MNRDEALQNLRTVLIQRREALRRALTGDLSMLNELRSQTHGDMADFALDAAQDEISSQLAEVESRELAQIDDALMAMREGVYGVCEGCGEKIPLARLHALPYATHCISCQREAEKGKHKSSSPSWNGARKSAIVGIDNDPLDIEVDVS